MDIHIHPTLFAGFAMRQNFGEIDLHDFILEAAQWAEEPIPDAETMKKVFRIHSEGGITVTLHYYCVSLLSGSTEPIVV